MSKTRVLMTLVGLLFAAGYPEAGNAAEEEPTMQLLPPPKIEGTVSVETTLAKRRSVRAFKSDPLTPAQVYQLLWAAQGITDKRRGLRIAPSAGATYPLVTYWVTDQGVYQYDPESHALVLKQKGDRRSALAAAALDQSWIRAAPASIALAAIYERTTGRYGTRGERYVHMEVGHAAQNVHLQAVALGLGSVPIGAFDDEGVAKVLGLSQKECPLYLISVGVPR